MSADPHAPTPPEPEPSALPNAETPIETLPQKRRYRKGEPGSAPAAPEGSDDEIIVLSSLLQNLIARKQGGESGEAGEAEAKGRMNRFVARHPPVVGAAPAGTTSPAPALTPATLAVPLAEGQTAPVAPPALPPATPSRPVSAGPEGMAAIAFPKFEPRAFQPDAQWQRPGSTWGRGVLYFGFTAALTLAGFLVGRYDSHKKDKATLPALAPATKLWTPTAAEQFSKALAADRDGDLATAHQMAVDLRKTFPDDPFLAAYLATIDTRNGRVNDVEAELSRQIGSGIPRESFAILNEAQGFNYTRRREFERAADCFKEVAKARPLDATNLLRLAESQRRQGSLADASNTLQQALIRLPAVPSRFDEREYMDFKRRLTLAELGREADLKIDLDQHLAAPSPTGYWLLTGAAVALQKKETASAIDLLKRAQAILPPAQFTGLLEDYFFRSFAYLPEMEPFIPTLSPERLQARRAKMEFFIDP